MTEDEAVEYAKDELRSNPRRMTPGGTATDQKDVLGMLEYVQDVQTVAGSVQQEV